MKKTMMKMFILLSLFVGCNQTSQEKLAFNQGSLLSQEKIRGELEKSVGNSALPQDLKNIGGLEKRDLKDYWLFGLTVTNTNNFFGGVISAHSDAKIVKMIPYKGKLYLYDVLAKKVAMSLKMDKKDGLELIDFASALKNKNIQDELKLQTQMRTQVLSYVSHGRSKVLNTYIDSDRVVLDIRYPMTGSMKKNGETLRKSGSVDLRVFLVRRSSLPLERTTKTVAQSIKDKYAFFGPTSMTKDEETPIRRFSLKTGKITFYLKDFPEDMKRPAAEAILSWNTAFDGNPVEVKLASKSMDIGDPRYNIVKWVKNTDKYTDWAGIAVPVFADPVTGTIISGSLLINGDFLRSDYAKRFSYSKRSSDVLKAKFGSLTLFSGRGEVPVIPHFTGATSFEEYIKGYYKETISHEIGHVLGLRHNFKGTVHAENGHTNSVMDYLPRKERAIFHGVGGYDKGAIRYAYYNERKNREFPFCTDEHVQEEYDCNKGDVGDPILHAFNALKDGFEAVATVPLRPHDKGTLGPIGSVLMNALKISLLKDQIEDYQMRNFVESADFRESIDKICDVTPSYDLLSHETEIVRENISSLRNGFVKRVLSLKGYPGRRYQSLYSDYVSHLQNQNLLSCFFE